MMHPFEKKYKEIVAPSLKEQFGYQSIYQIPRIVKVTLNVGLGSALKDAQYGDIVADSLTRMTGQKPIKTRAKKSIAGFKIREGLVIGMKVTLRKKRMLDFLEKLVTFVLPRARDFRGLDMKAIDRNGNLSIGIKESSAFPEIKSEELEKIHGLEVAISTNAKTRAEGVALFTLLGFPFKK